MFLMLYTTQALRMLGEFQPALKALEAANRLMPNKKDIAIELTLLDKYVIGEFIFN